MFRFFMLMVILTLAYGNILKPKVPLLDGRIVGGENAKISSYPHQVSVRLFGSHSCGGSILNSRIVLTAAHCIFTGFTSWHSIQYGVTDLGSSDNVIAAARTLKHERFSARTTDYDVALIFLKYDIPLGVNAKPIALAKTEPKPDTKAVVTGWGTVAENGSSSNTLQSVGVLISDSSVCRNQYKDFNEITARMLCAGVSGGGKDACQGDSGGPLIANGEQVGIVSWGFGCARENYAGVYSNVANLNAWINENAK